jgi:23S rRNA (uracil1939-C5)-methyltransferase
LEEVEVFATAPGDRARVLLGGRRKGRRQGWLQHLEEPAPGRVEPRCPHFGLCGGCALQHLDYEPALRAKTATLQKALEERCPGGLPPCPAPSPWHYRGKLELSFLGDPPELGFFLRQRFSRLVAVRECFLAPPVNRTVLDAVRDWVQRHRLPGWNPRTHQGLLRNLVLRHSLATGDWLATLVTAPGEVPLDDLADRLVELGAAGVLHALNRSPAGAVVVESSRLVRGRERLIERVGEVELELSWQSFFQNNPAGFALLLAQAREWLAPISGYRLLDLFCGVGTVGLSLGRQAGRLVGVESLPEAVEDARRNARRNGVEGEFHQGRAEDWADLAADVAVLDPPRAGCHPRLLARLVREGPPRLLYISCNPWRLLEELDHLQPAYRLERWRLYDLFPQTPHVEALCLLQRTP